MKIKFQKQRETLSTYQVVLTMPKFKSSKEVTCHWDFNDYGECLDKYRLEVKDAADHSQCIGTTRIIGIYKRGICHKQTIIKAYCKY